MKNYEKMKKAELIKIIKEFERKEKEESAIDKLIRLLDIGIWQFNIKENKSIFDDSEEKLRAIFNTANIGISITDKNARYVIFNKWWTDNLGYDSEEMKCLTNIDITHPEDREKTRIYFQKIIKGEVDRYRIEKRFVRKDNSIFLGDLSVSAVKDKNNNISLVVGMVIDITEQKNLENKLIKSEKKYRQIIELADEGIWVIDTEEKTTFVNPKMAKMFGYEEKEMIGKHIFTFMDKTEAELCKEKVKRRKNGITEQHERIYLKKNGEKIYTHISTSPITDDNGNYAGAIALVTDITDRKKAEKEMLMAKQEAESASRTKSEFLANISHEFRTPLNAIIGYSQILKKDEKLAEDYKTVLNIIERSGKHLLALINDILDISKIEAKKMEIVEDKFNFGDLLYFIKNIISERVKEKNLSFEMHCGENLPITVYGDKTKLKQILLNLLWNSVKFTEKGTIKLNIEKQGKKIRFEIEDTGMGIQEDKLKEIFLPFKQLSPSLNKTDGTGLGLSISYNLVKLMGGELKAESIREKGSKFSFEIELTDIFQGKFLQLKDIKVDNLPEEIPEVTIPEEILKKLHHYSSIGDLKEVKEELKKINSDEYNSFYNLIKSHADRFEIDKISSILNNIIKGGKKHEL